MIMGVACCCYYYCCCNTMKLRGNALYSGEKIMLWHSVIRFFILKIKEQKRTLQYVGSQIYFYENNLTRKICWESHK